MNDLVRLSTSNVNTAEPISDSLIFANETSTTHRNVIQLIEKYFTDLEEFGTCAVEMRTSIDTLGRKNKDERVYLLNEMQVTLLLTMSRNTPKVMEFKKRIVRAFFLMRNELQARVETRRISKDIRKDLTIAIKDNVKPEGDFKKFAYSNYTKLVYKKVIGMDVKKIKATRNIPEKDNVRDHFTLDELSKIQALESKIAGIIEMSDTFGKTDKEVYDIVKNKLDIIF